MGNIRKGIGFGGEECEFIFGYVEFGVETFKVCY